MSNRIAFFSDGVALMEYFGLEDSGEVIFESHYNIARGHHIPVIKQDEEAYDIIPAAMGQRF